MYFLLISIIRKGKDSEAYWRREAEMHKSQFRKVIAKKGRRVLAEIALCLLCYYNTQGFEYVYGSSMIKGIYLGLKREKYKTSKTHQTLFSYSRRNGLLCVNID